MYKVYEVIENETIEDVAKKFGVTSEVIREINGFDETMNFTPGTIIVVPKKEEDLFDIYTVMRNDTLYSIAKKYDISDTQLALMNGLEKDEYIYPNQDLLVPKPNVRIHVVLENESLHKVATRLGVAEEDIIRQNDNILLEPDQIISYRF